MEDTCPQVALQLRGLAHDCADDRTGTNMKHKHARIHRCGERKRETVSVSKSEQRAKRKQEAESEAKQLTGAALNN